MSLSNGPDPRSLARYVGFALLSTIIVGIISAFAIAEGIDVNLTADVLATANNMLQAELPLRAKAYVAGFVFGLQAVVAVGLFLLLMRSGPLLAGSSLFVSLGAAVLTLLGALFALNVAEIVGDPAFTVVADEAQRLLLISLQVTSDYTSFHFSLILSSAANAGFFYLFLRSGLIPKIIAGWGLFASLFVATTMVARDFIPALGNNVITLAFMVSNLIALISTGVYLFIYGVRTQEASAS